MRTVVLDRDLVEGEVKPHEYIEEYRRLLDGDVREHLVGGLSACSCPGCGNADAEQAFERFGLRYVHCLHCSSLYVSPRPSAEALDAFYRGSDSATYWRESILPATREARRSKMLRPRVEWLLDVVDEYMPQARTCLSLGYHSDLLLEELLTQEIGRFSVTVANPSADIEFADKELSDVSIVATGLGDLTDLQPADLVFAFDIIDRCTDPDTLFAVAGRCLVDGGLLLATTTLGSGFDIQVLWESADHVYPPERLNLLSVEGFEALCNRHRFEILEFSTPGMFDVHTVTEAIQAEPTKPWPRFIRYLAEMRDEQALEALQEYVQRFRLSSFGRVVLRKNT